MFKNQLIKITEYRHRENKQKNHLSIQAVFYTNLSGTQVLRSDPHDANLELFLRRFEAIGVNV